jgi:hypothetical protein
LVPPQSVVRSRRGRPREAAAAIREMAERVERLHAISTDNHTKRWRHRRGPSRPRRHLMRQGRFSDAEEPS